MTGMYATIAILAALRHRDADRAGPVHRHGAARLQVAMLANLGASYLATGKAPGAPATRTRTSCPTRCSRWPTATDPGGRQRRPVQPFCAVAGARSWRRPALARTRPGAPPRRAGAAARRDADARPRADWLARWRRPRCPAGRSTTWQVFADPQVQDRGMTVTCRTRSPATLPLVASPIKLVGHAGALPACAAASWRGTRKPCSPSSA